MKGKLNVLYLRDVKNTFVKFISTIFTVYLCPGQVTPICVSV